MADVDERLAAGSPREPAFQQSEEDQERGAETVTARYGPVIQRYLSEPLP